MAYASFMISPRGFSMGGRNVSTSTEIAMWPLLSCSFDFSLFHLYDEREIRNRTCRRTWGHIPRGAPDPRQSSLPLDSQEDDLVPGEVHVAVPRLDPERRARLGGSLEEAGPERGRVIRGDPAPPDPVAAFEWDIRYLRRLHGAA